MARMTNFRSAAIATGNEITDSAYDNVKIVSNNIEDVTLVSTTITSGDLTIIADNITSILPVVDSMDKITIAADSIDSINNVAEHTAVVGLVAEDLAKGIGTNQPTDSAILNTLSNAISAADSALAASVSDTNSQLRSWETEAERLTADSYATEAEDVFVKMYTSNGDGTFTIGSTDKYSAFHWAEKTLADADKVALDLVATNQDTIDTAADRVQTGQDVAATAANLVITNADVVTTTLKASEAIASELTTLSYKEAAETLHDIVVAKEASVSPHYDAIDAIYTNITDIGTVSDSIVSVDVLASNLEAILNAENTLTYTYNEIIGVQGQVTFGVVYEDPDTVEVFYNGRLLSKTDWNLSSGTMLVLVTPIDATGDIITVRTWNKFNILDALTAADLQDVLSDFYNKSEIDSQVSTVQDAVNTNTTAISNTYDKSEIDAQVANIQSAIDTNTSGLLNTYTKSEIDTQTSAMQSSIDTNTSALVNTYNRDEIDIKTTTIQSAVDINTSAILALASGQGQIVNSSTPAFASIPKYPLTGVLDFAEVVPSTNIEVFEFDTVNNLFKMYQETTYTFMSTIEIKSNVSASRTVTFNLIDNDTEVVLLSQAQDILLASGNTESYPMSTLLVIDSPKDVRVEVTCSDTGYELRGFSSILMSSTLNVNVDNVVGTITDFEAALI